MPKVSTNLLYSLIFSLLLAGGVFIYNNQTKPDVLAVEDFEGIDSGIEPTVVIGDNGFEPIVTPTPMEADPSVIDQKNLYVQKYNEASSRYASADTITVGPSNIQLSDFIRINKTLLLTVARYRLMISNIYQLVERIEISNETNQIPYREINVIRALIKNTRDKLLVVSSTVDGMDNSINSLSTSTNLENSMSEINNLSNQVETTLTEISTDLQYIIPGGN